jgi:hypothetical protein
MDIDHLIKMAHDPHQLLLHVVLQRSRDFNVVTFDV